MLGIHGPYRSIAPECNTQDYIEYIVRYDTITQKAVIVNLVPNDTYLVSAGPTNRPLFAKISHDGLTIVTNSAGNDDSRYAFNPLVYRWLRLDPNLGSATASVTRYLNYATSQLTTLCPTGTIIRS